MERWLAKEVNSLLAVSLICSVLFIE